MESRPLTGYVLLLVLVASLIVPLNASNVFAASIPTAVNDFATTNAGLPVIIDILSNDLNAGRTFTVNIVTPPAHGTIPLPNPLDPITKTITYTADPSYAGQDSFQYTITNSLGTSNVATVSITVNENANNKPPTVSPVTFTIPENSPSVNLNVLANATDPDGDSLIVVGVSGPGPQHGAATISLDQKSVTYAPFNGYFGQDGFTFSVSDGHLHTVSGISATVIIKATNVPPQADNLNFEGVENNPILVKLSGADTNNNPFTFVIDTNPTNGHLNATSGQFYTYTPSQNFAGYDQFTYHTTDGTLNSNEATVRIVVDSFVASITTPSSTTNNPSQTITGTAAPGATVKVYSGTTLIGTTTADSSGNWSTVVTLPQQGANNITAIETDSQGHVSGASNQIVITLDTTLPTITITSPVNGASVSSPTLTITSTALDSGSGINQVTVSINGGTQTLATLNGQNWSLLTSSLINGQNTIIAQATDNVGNTATTNSITITVGLNAPVITTPSSTTNNPSQTITGTAAPGATVKVYSGTTLIGTTTADSSGNWSTPATLATGANTISATATLNGMTSLPSNLITITVGLNAPVITTPSSTTLVLLQTITGTADPGATVFVYSGTTLLTTTNADSSGNWSIFVTLSLGVNNITAVGQIHGLTSLPSNLIKITIGAITTGSPVITTPSSTTNNPSQTITGTAAPGATVKVYSGTTLIGTTTADSSGNWSTPATLATGANTITATATVNGITSPQSNSITITVGTSSTIDKINGYVIFGTKDVHIEQNDVVTAGNVGLQNSGQIHIEQGSKLVSSSVVGSTVHLEKTSLVGNAYFNRLDNDGTVLGTKNTPLALPVVTHLPIFPTFNAGSAKIQVHSGIKLLTSGSYDDISTGDNVTLEFTGGTYYIDSLSFGKYVTLKFDAPSTIYLEDAVDGGQGTLLNPTLAADKVLFYAGSHIHIGQSSTVNANMYAPNDEIHLEQNSIDTGAFLAQSVHIEQGSTINFDYGFPAN